MSPAHYYTLFRVFVGPIFLFVYSTYSTLGISPWVMPWILLALLITAEFTDVFDGYIARKYNKVTDLGKILDPMADSIYRISMFLTFTLPPVSIPIWILFIFLYRDSLISTLRTICAFKGLILAARISGKIKAVIQGIASILIIFLMILESTGFTTKDQLTIYSTIIAAMAASYTIYSGIDYIYANRSYVHKVLND
ncbi:CDP-diacylglycerol--glycerol-3-phosphate 3-phosphatidyltransferase [Chlamydiales bacterium STE3]|nr:CDP-diacylglycerol--glycerol-3-phosphate 3-phosphatidyltransferase [Chlamydiales bacterium STE3]